jgi:hypothetical protein
MRKLLILSFFLPLMTWAQTTLPPCPASGYKHDCVGSVQYSNGVTYVGEFKFNLSHGKGVESNSYGDRYVGEFRNGKRNGEGISYDLNAKAILSGKHVDGVQTRSNMYPVATNLYPYDLFQRTASEPPSQTPTNFLAAPPIDPSKTERDRLAAEVEAERKKRQELETQLAEVKERERLLAEAKERDRQQAQAPQPQRPQVALRNERRLALVIGNSSYKISPLDNPANDANDVAESLKKFGFQTTLVRNATLGQMREATRKFADQLPFSRCGTDLLCRTWH